MDTDLVLGVAVTPTAIGLALVRGRRADGDVLDRDLIDTAPPRAGHPTGAVAETAKDAVLRTYSTTVKHGYRIHAVGVAAAGGEPDDARRLVEVLRRVGCRNVALVDPSDSSDAGSVAAGHAVEMVAEPQTVRIPTRGRHRHAAPSRTPRRLLIGAGATGVLSALAATVVVNATSDEPPPAAPPPSVVTAVPAAGSTVPTAMPTTPRSVFTRTDRETSTPTTVSVTRITATPSPEPAPSEPSTDPIAVDPTAPSEHLPDTAGQPRLPGPA